MGQINNRLGNTLLETGTFPPCRVATTGSNNTLAGLQTIDGVVLISGDRVLVKDQTDRTQNGIYAASSGNWLRTTDALSNTQYFQGMMVVVALGSTYSNQLFICSCPDDPVIIGTSLLTFAVAAPLAVAARERLSADRTYYIRQPRVAVTITIASPGVITWAAHGLVANATVAFDTTSALPTGLTRGVVYYVKTVVSVNSFTVSATAGGTVIATSGSQSGTQYGQTGDDTKSGLDNGPNALMTLQRYALNVMTNIDFNGHSVFGQAAAGAYKEAVSLGPYVGRTIQGHTMPTIQGDAASPRGVVIIGGIVAVEGAVEWVIRNLEIDGDGSNNSVTVDKYAWVVIDGVTYGANPLLNQNVVEDQGLLEFNVNANNAIIGGAASFIVFASVGQMITSGDVVIAVSGNPTYTSDFVVGDSAGQLIGPTLAFSVTGTVTARKWSLANGAFMNLGGRDPNSVFPGSQNGVRAGTLVSKLIAFTYNLATATGTQAVTGVGFKPSSVAFLYAVDGTQAFGVGLTDSGGTGKTIYEPSNFNIFDVQPNNCIQFGDGAGANRQIANISTYDLDGFTLSWIKTGAPVGTLTVYALCLQ